MTTINKADVEAAALEWLAGEACRFNATQVEAGSHQDVAPLDGAVVRQRKLHRRARWERLFPRGP